jgi:type I restriction enzyme M protein
MIRENKYNLSLLEDSKARLWQSLNLIRGSVSICDYDFILYLLILERYDVFASYELSSLEFFKNDLHTSISSYSGENADAIRKLYREYYVNAIKELDDKIVFDIVHAFASIDDQLLNSHFSEVFDDLLYKLIRSHSRYGGEFLLPLELSRFACSLANLSSNTSIYNPFAGLASFAILLNNDVSYLGQEIDLRTWVIGSLRIMAYDKSGSAKLLLGDSLKGWNPKRESAQRMMDDFFDFRSQDEKYDLIVSNPPFGMRLPGNIDGRFGTIRNAEQFLIEKGLQDLKQDGKLIAVISQSFLSNLGSEQNLRQHLIEDDLLDIVISFPGGLLMNTGIPISILVINKKKSKRGFVRFIDAKTFVTTNSSKEKILDTDALNAQIMSCDESETTRTIPNDLIREFGFKLNVQRYFQKEYDGVALGDLGSLVRGQRVIENQTGKFVRIRNLKDDALDYYLNLDSIEVSDFARIAQRIDEPCLLLASRWKTLKPTYFDYTGTSIIISSDIFAFNVDATKCDIAYLINELHSAYVTEQLEAYRTGSVVPMIRRDDLLSIKIALPSLEEQNAIVKQKAMILAEEKKKELALFNKIHGLEAEIMEQNSYLRHTLAGPSSNLKDSVVSLKKILLDQVVPTNPGMLELKMSNKHLVTLGEYLNIIERDVTKIVSAVKSQLKVNTGIESKKLLPVEVISFLEKYAVEYNERADLNFKVEFEFEKYVFIGQGGERIRTFILANDDLLRDLFDNLIDNAVKHAFEIDANNRIEIFLLKNTENEDTDEIQVLVSNTGKPFPEHFTTSDFIRKGSKYGTHAGDGFGGWYINEIIKKLDGDFEIIDETGGEGLPGTDLATSFEINFPIIETEENASI